MSELTFAIPAQLNGEQLCKELNAEMVYISGDLLYIVGDLTEAQAAAGIVAHKPIFPPDNLAAKEALLEKLGITAVEAKLLLS
jgi:hypothetical protein